MLCRNGGKEDNMKLSLVLDEKIKAKGTSIRGEEAEQKNALQEPNVHISVLGDGRGAATGPDLVSIAPTTKKYGRQS